MFPTLLLLTMSLYLCSSTFMYNDFKMSFKPQFLSDHSPFWDACGFALKISGAPCSTLVLHPRIFLSSSDFIEKYQTRLGTIRLSNLTSISSKVTILVFQSEVTLYQLQSISIFDDLSIYYVMVFQEVYLNLNKLFNHLWDNYRLYNYLVVTENNSNIFAFDVISKKVVTFDVEELSRHTQYHVGDYKNWNRTDFNVVIFQRIPSLVIKGTHMSGYDGELLMTMKKYCNITLMLQTTSDDERYGFALSNGTFVGTLKDMINRRVDFTGNGHFVKWYNFSKIDFTHYIASEKLCVSVPKAGKVPHFIAVLKVFNPISWMIFLSVYGSVGSLYGLFKIIYKKIGFYRNKSTSTCMQMFALSLAMSIPCKNKFWSEKLILGPLFVLSFVIVNNFQTLLMAFISSPIMYKNINTLQELRESKIEIWTSSKDVTSLLLDIENLNIIQKSQHVMLEASKVKTIARVVRMNVLQEQLDQSPSGNKTSSPHHIVRECLGSYFVSHIIPKGSPVESCANRIISSLTESGVINKWILAGIPTSSKTIKATRKFGIISKFKAFNIQDFLLAFLFLLSGLAISTVALLLESLWKTNKKTKLTTFVH